MLEDYPEEPPVDSSFVHILNLGAGVQSTSLFLLSARQDEPEFVPRFDYAIFADTQEEPASVYEHLDWLRSLDGAPPILVGTSGKLGDDLVTGFAGLGQRFAGIPAFTKIPGFRRQQTRRQCTRDYKINVVERIIRQDIMGMHKGERINYKFPKIMQYFGLSLDEPKRVARTKMRYAAKAWVAPAFPLFDMEWTRGDCEAYIAEVAPGRKIVKSACVFCPYHSNKAWRRLRDEDPDGWARAVQIDEAIRRPDSICTRGMDSTMYLHESCVPLDQADIGVPQSPADGYASGFTQECEGMCGV